VGDVVMSVLDVAAYILAKQGDMTAMKLQKLVYYSQAWSLAWDGKKLFDEPIKAWVGGPVVEELFETHRGRFLLHPGEIAGNPTHLDAAQCKTVDAVLKIYGSKSSEQLTRLISREAPWRDARRNIPVGVRGDAQISAKNMTDWGTGGTARKRGEYGRAR